MSEVREPAVPRLAVTRAEAAKALGVSVDFFDEHVAQELRCVRRGRRRLYPISEIHRWLDRVAERAGLRSSACAWPVGFVPVLHFAMEALKGMIS